MDFADNKQQESQKVQQGQQEQQQNLQAPVQKARLDLGGGKSHEFGLHVDNMDMFDDKETASKSVLRSRTTELKTTLDSQLRTGANFGTRRVTETDQFHVASSRLCKDTVWFRFSDSPEMIRVKKTVNFLNNLLDLKMDRYVKQQGNAKAFDTVKLKEELDTAFDEAHSACVDYIDKKEREGKARKRHGIRRKQKVVDMMKMLEKEKPKYDALVEAIRLESLTENSVEKNKECSPRVLSSKFRSSVVLDKAEWQNEGNSTDVYRVRIVEKVDGKDQEKIYYLKRNLPLISADINGFLDRRITQLDKSYARMTSTDPKEKALEEARLKKAKMEATDYTNAKNFLKALKEKRDKASVADKSKVDKTITDMFRHDFDRMFNELQQYNTAIDYVVSNTDKDWDMIAKDPGHALNEIAKIIVELKGQKANAGVGEEQQKVVLEKKNAFQWILEKLKDDLDKAKDADIINALEDVHKSDGANGIENLFRVMLGKEVELFGQMRDRGKGDEREQSAANNSGVYRIAEITGLTDVVTSSDIRIVGFKDRDEEWVEDFCTVTEEAPGEELLNILKKAENEKKKIDYTPEAIRQLMRLQALDTVTRQVDRHGRNLKCEVEALNGRIVIKSIMSYDQDMSFAEENLKDTFKAQEDGTLDFQGFLPPMTTKIKKDSAFFKYLKYERFQMVPDIFKKVEEPRFRYPMYKSDSLYARKGDEMSLCLPFFKRYEFSDPEMKINPDDNAYSEIHGKVYRIPKTAKERKLFNGFMTQDAARVADKKADMFMVINPGEENLVEEAKKLVEEEAEKERRRKGKNKEAEEEPKLVQQEEKAEEKKENRDEVTAKLGRIISDIRGIVIRGSSPKDKAEREEIEEKYKKEHKTRGNRVPRHVTDFKTKYTDEEKIKLCKYIYELKEMYDTYDFRFVSYSTNMPGTEGYGKLDLWIQQFIYFFINAYKDDQVVIDEFLKIEGKYDTAKPKEKIFSELQDENGDIILPTYLHFDQEAYEGLKRLASDETDGALKLKLEALNFNERKILLNKERAKEMLAQIDEAQKKAEKFYQLMGWKEPPQNKFFLSKDDYKGFKNIEELAVDPGMTYLSIDNRNYIYRVPEFSRYASDNEYMRAFKAEEKKRHDPKRWDDQDFGKNIKKNIDYATTMMENPLRGNISVL